MNSIHTHTHTRRCDKNRIYRHSILDWKLNTRKREKERTDTQFARTTSRNKAPDWCTLCKHQRKKKERKRNSFPPMVEHHVQLRDCLIFCAPIFFFNLLFEVGFCAGNEIAVRNVLGFKEYAASVMSIFTCTELHITVIGGFAS